MTLFKHTKFLAYEKAALGELFRAFETSHKRHLVDDGDVELIVSNDGAGLSAVSRSARTGWAQFVCDELAAHLAYNARDLTVNQAAFLFTLVDVKCAKPSSQLNVDLRPIVRRLRKGLQGFSYLGVIEPGLYSHISVPGTNLDQSKCISWHLHVLVWGITRNGARRLAAKLNRSGRYVAVAPSQVGAHQMQVREHEFSNALAYLLKRPTHAYRLALLKEPVARGDLQHKQYRTRLRPGEHITLYLQLRHLTLPDMWVADGEGGAILTRVKRRCWTAIRRHERGRRPRYCHRPFFQASN